MTRAGVVGTLLWATLVAVAAVVVARATYTTDLSAFLPSDPTETQRLLVDQLRDGLASRLIIVAIEGADAKTRARLSQGVASRLRTDRNFVSINNGESSGTDRDREFLFNHRYLLSDSVTPQRFTVDGLKDALQDTLDLLASPAGLIAKSLLTRDPTGEMVQIISQLSSGGAPRTAEGVWASGDGERALIVAQTVAHGSDTDGQQLAVEAVQHAFAAASAELPTAQAEPRAAATTSPAGPGHPSEATTVPSGTRAAAPATAGAKPLALKMSGPGVFAVVARATIIKEVTRLSILSTLIIVVLLLGVYRSVAALLLGLVPVASGALAGVAGVALGLGVVHGITLGFGITLIGEAVDYSIYLFIQSQERGGSGHPNWQRSVWPTIRLGMLTSICGFASLLPSGFPGLTQLGLYSIAGLIAAALVTRFVLPYWLPRNFAIRDVTPLGVVVAGLLERVSHARVALAVLAVLAGTVLYVHRDTFWNRELAALSPVSQADQDLDAQLRVDIRAPDVRYLVIVSAPDKESALGVAEKVGTRLEQLIDANVIGGFETPVRYLPSQALQRARQASLPPTAELRERLQKAVAGMPVRAERLEPFLLDAETARTQPLITRKDLDGTSVATGFDALMLQDGSGWVALLPLRAAASNPFAIDDARVRKAVSEAAPGQATVLDLKGEADRLYSRYLAEAVRLSLAGFAAIVILLLVALRSPARVIRVVVPLALAVLVVAGGFALLGRQLTILHVIGMLLIVAVGSNYALFFDRRATDSHVGSVPLTLASLLIANAATIVSFGILAFSSVPVLSALGSTVAPGALLALLFSALLARHLPPAQAVPG